MLGRKTWLHLITRMGIGAGTLCLVGILLAAIPNHHAPAGSTEPTQNSKNSALDQQATRRETNARNTTGPQTPHRTQAEQDRAHDASK